MFTIGCDPEVFLTRGEEFISAIPYINGTKYEPDILPHGGMLQWDNVCMEFGTKPAYTIDEWLSSLEETVRDIRKRISPTFTPRVIASANFPIKEVSSPEAKEFGCSPDLNAYSGMKNEPPSPNAFPTFRSCGGHIHIGYVDGAPYIFLKDHYDTMQYVKVLDMYLGVISSIIDNRPDAVKRRELYGKAGCYRKTDYGVEYRTLSNYWLKSKTYSSLIYSLVDDSLDHMLHYGTEVVKEIGEDSIIEAVENPDMAERVIDRLFDANIYSRDTNSMISSALVEAGNDNLFEVWE